MSDSSKPSIEFGIHVPMGWRSEFTPVTDPAEQWKVTLQFAKMAEAGGLDVIWVGDHFHTIPGQPNSTIFESWTLLSALSQQTERVRFGHMVGCAPFRHPGLIAKMGATLDVLSGGRFIWGIGAGWHEEEFAGYGIEVKSPKERIAVLRETVEIVKAMWTDDAPIYKGDYFSIDGARCDPKPLQSPLPQILIGAWGERYGSRLVAEHADRCNFPGDLGTVAHKLAVLSERCAEIGRDESEIMKSWTGELFLREDESEILDNEPRAMMPMPMELWRATGIVGTPEQACERIQELLDIGLIGFTFSLSDCPDTESLRLFIEKVLPEFR